MWVARDKNSNLQLFISSKPERDNDRGIWDIFVEENGMKIGRNIEDFIYIDENLFKNLSWEDSPIEVRLERVVTEENNKDWLKEIFNKWKNGKTY